MIELVDVDDAPVATLPYLNAARGGGTERRRLHVERARVRGLPPGLDAVIATSDLQGVVIEPARASRSCSASRWPTCWPSWRSTARCRRPIIPTSSTAAGCGSAASA